MPTILVLSISDQSASTLATHGGLDLHGSYDVEANLIAPLRNIFSKVIVFDVKAHHVRYGPTATTKELKDLILKESPDYMILLTSMYEIEPEILFFAQKNGVKTISWFFDDEMRFENYSVIWIPVSDFVLTASPNYVKKYQEYGVPAYLTFMSPNEEIFQKKEVDKDIDVLFIGSNIADRQEFVDYLKQHNINVTTFGKGWDTGYLTQTIDLALYYNRSKINLCFTKGYDQSKKQYKGKIFEVCMCGGFLLVEYIDGMESYFEDGVDAVFFKDKQELLFQIQKYLPSSTLREKIAGNGNRKVMEKYRMSVQLTKIFEDIFNRKDQDLKTGNCNRMYEMKQYSQNLKKARSYAASYHFSFALAHLKEKNIKLFFDEYLFILKNNILKGFSLPAYLMYSKIICLFQRKMVRDSSQ